MFKVIICFRKKMKGLISYFLPSTSWSMILLCITWNHFLIWFYFLKIEVLKFIGMVLSLFFLFEPCRHFHYLEIELQIVSRVTWTPVRQSPCILPENSQLVLTKELFNNQYLVLYTYFPLKNSWALSLQNIPIYWHKDRNLCVIPNIPSYCHRSDRE